MPQMYFNYVQFATQIMQAENEKETEELLMCLKEYIENMIEYVHELEMDKCNLETEVASLQDQVYQLEGQLY